MTFSEIEPMSFILGIIVGAQLMLIGASTKRDSRPSNFWIPTDLREKRNG